MPSTSTTRRAVLAFLAGLGGCGAREPSESDATGTTRRDPTSTGPTTDPGSAATSPPASTQPPDRTVTAPRPSTIESVDADWPSVGFDAENTGRSSGTTGPVPSPRVQWVARVPAGGAPPMLADSVAVALGSDGTLTGVDATDGTGRWQAEIPENPTAPVVADGTLCTLTYSLDRPNAVVGFDLETGRRLWTTGEFSEAFGDLNVGDGTVYATVDEEVYAIDAATGERRWRTDFPDIGSTAGPVTAADDLVVVPDVDGAVVALDPATGDRLWSVDQPIHGTKYRVVVAAHGRLYVPTGRRHTDPYDTPTLYALDPATGERVGAYASEGAGPPGVAATGEGVVVVDRQRDVPDRPPETPVRTSGITPPGTTATPTSRPPKPPYADGVAADLSGREWRVELAASAWYAAQPAVAGGHAYVGSREGLVTAVDVASGARTWTHEFPTPLDLRGPAVADGVCVFGSSSGLIALGAD